jgi:hypothetical protein
MSVPVPLPAARLTPTAALFVLVLILWCGHRHRWVAWMGEFEHLRADLSKGTVQVGKAA